MNITKQTTTIYKDAEMGFVYNFAPIADSLSIKKTKIGYEVRYLTLDSDSESPEKWEDTNLFLVHYHRDFWIENKNIISKDDVRAWYQGESIPQQKDYFVFALSAYIHGGVALSLNESFACDTCGWDTSHVGVVLVSKEEFKTKGKAVKMAQGLIEEWNQYLSGDVYGVVIEKYDNEKNPVDSYSCWGFYGYDYALQELQKRTF